MNGQRIRKLVGAAAPAALALAAAGLAQPSSSLPPLPRPPYVYVDQFDGENQLKVLEVTTVTDQAVDTSGLQVDLSCARGYRYWATAKGLRTELLRTGCAKITASSPPETESAAQKSAQEKQLGYWKNTTSSSASTSTTSASTTASSSTDTAARGPVTPSWLTKAVTWTLDNWDKVLGILLGLLGLSWVHKAIDRWRHKRDVDILLTGLPGAGKTDLWTAWQDDSAPHSNAKPTVQLTPTKDLPPAPWGEHTLYPTVVDGAGTDPASMLNFLRRSPKRNKRVLIFVVSPFSSNTTNSTTFDHDYVVEQRGYANFPRAVLGAAGDRIKPDLVVLFISKFDLISQTPPGDTASASLRDRVATEFGKIIQSMRSDCKRENIPFEFIVGSSKKGWGIRELREYVTKALTADRRR